MTTRRGFLGAILAAAAAPAIIKAEMLMPVRQIIVPPDPAEVLSRVYVDNLQRSILRIGDVFTISGIYEGRGALRQFEVTAVQGSSIMVVQPALVL